MIIIRYHNNDQHNASMKLSRLFLNRDDFERWYSRNRDHIKNVTIQGA